MPQPLYPGKARYPLYRRLGGLVWKSAEKLALTAIRSPDRPVRSQSLYGFLINCPLLTTPQTVTSAPNPTQYNTTQHNTPQHNTTQHIPLYKLQPHYRVTCMLHVHPHEMYQDNEYTAPLRLFPSVTSPKRVSPTHFQLSRPQATTTFYHHSITVTIRLVCWHS
jgi:hypothetical protein